MSPNKSTPPSIPHPRRLLLLTPPSTNLAPTLLETLTQTIPPPPPNDSYAGTTHTLSLQTKYYNADVPVWVDEITNVQDWKTEFLREEAREVVRVVGAWVWSFELHRSGANEEGGEGKREELEGVLEAVNRVVDAHTRPSADGAEDDGLLKEQYTLKLAVGVGSSLLSDAEREAWEDVCMGCGWEFVELRAQGKNEFGEKLGAERLREALEAQEWEGGGLEPEDDGVEGLLEGIGEEEGLGSEDWGREEGEMSGELVGLKMSLLGHGEAEGLKGGERDGHEDEAEAFGKMIRADAGMGEKEQVEDLDFMMGRLLAVREQGAGMPEAQRKRMAAKAVRELLGEDAKGG